MKKLSKLLPDVHFKGAKKNINWRKPKYDTGPDDDKPRRTPKDVKQMLGFDPRKTHKE